MKLKLLNNPLFTGLTNFGTKHAGGILMAAGVVFFGLTVYEAAKEGPTVAEAAKELKAGDITLKEAAVKAGPSMMKIAVAMAASIGCFGGSKALDMKKIASLTATCAYLSKDVEELNKFRAEATKVMGDDATKDVETKVFNQTNKDLHATPGRGDDVWETETGEVLYYYARHRYFFRTSPQHVKDSMKHANEILGRIDDGTVALNDINEWVTGTQFPGDEDLEYNASDGYIRAVTNMSIIHPKTGEAAVVFDLATKPHVRNSMFG